MFSFLLKNLLTLALANAWGAQFNRSLDSDNLKSVGNLSIYTFCLPCFSTFRPSFLQYQQYPGGYGYYRGRRKPPHNIEHDSILVMNCNLYFDLSQVKNR